MANRHMKRCSTSLTSHLSEWPSSTNQQTTGVGENLEKGNPPALLVRLKLVRPLWETVWRFFEKLKIQLLYDLAVPLLDTYLKEMKLLFQRDISTPMLSAAHSQ